MFDLWEETWLWLIFLIQKFIAVIASYNSSSGTWVFCMLQTQWTDIHRDGAATASWVNNRTGRVKSMSSFNNNMNNEKCVYIYTYIYMLNKNLKTSEDFRRHEVWHIIWFLQIYENNWWVGICFVLQILISVLDRWRLQALSERQGNLAKLPLFLLASVASASSWKNTETCF